MATRQYARLLASWLRAIGLVPLAYGTHSLRRQLRQAACFQPAFRLLVNGGSQRHVIEHPAPGRIRLDDVAQDVEHLAQRVSTLARPFSRRVN
jgi:hypothetical protein